MRDQARRSLQRHRREEPADALGKAAPAACNSYSQRTSQSADAHSASPPPRARDSHRRATSPTPQIVHGKGDPSSREAPSEKPSDARDNAMDLNNEGPEADPMDLDKEGRGFSYVHDLEWHLGVSPMKALAPAEPDQCQPASLVNEYAGHHWTGAMAGDARVGGREAGAETFRCACRAVPAKRVQCSPHSTACFDILLPIRTYVLGCQGRLIDV